MKLEGVKCTNETHQPLLFSWNEAAELCSEIHNGHLPEFISRKEQEESIPIIKETPNLYPTEAVYINLQQKIQNEVNKNHHKNTTYIHVHTFRQNIKKRKIYLNTER